MANRRGRQTGGESNRIPCSVCGFQIDTKVQRIGGGAGDDVQSFTDTGGANPGYANVYSRGKSIAHFGQLFEGAYGFGGGNVGGNIGFQSVVTRTSVCPFCGTDNWLVGSRGTL